MKFRILEKSVFSYWTGEYEQKFLVQKKSLFWWSTICVHNTLTHAEITLTCKVKRASAHKNKPSPKIHVEVEV
jgi:hypothetical protein